MSKDFFFEPDNSQRKQRHHPFPPDVLEEIYAEMRKIASRHLNIYQKNAELHTTAIVQEAYLKLQKSDKLHLQTKGEFLLLAAQAMRYLIIDFIRKAQAAKRKGALKTISLDTAPILKNIHLPEQYLRLHEALHVLSAMDVKQGRIIELRFFGGLTIEETAEALGTSAATVKREWRSARAWLHVNTT